MAGYHSLVFPEEAIVDTLGRATSVTGLDVDRDLRVEEEPPDVVGDDLGDSV